MRFQTRWRDNVLPALGVELPVPCPEIEHGDAALAQEVHEGGQAARFALDQFAGFGGEPELGVEIFPMRFKCSVKRGIRAAKACFVGEQVFVITGSDLETSYRLPHHPDLC